MSANSDPPAGNGDTIKIGDMQEISGAAIGRGATAIHVDALGDVGDIITGTKISLVNRAAAQRVASKRQVSAPPAEYIPRPWAEKTLAELLTADYGDFHTVYLYGLPGAGKSWLARKVASGLDGTFVDGILGADLQVTNIRTAVWKFIEPYDETISQTSLTSANEFTAAMQEAFGDRRILIVLDHLPEWRENWEELRNWLPQKCRGCLVLLITHQPPEKLYEHESSCRLSGLTEEEAVAMFTQRLLGEGDDIVCDEVTMLALAEKVDYSPAAIAAIARDINVKLVSPRHYLEALATQRGEEDPIIYLEGLESVFNTLPAEGRTLFPFLGILRNVPWTADDLFAISPERNRDIELGLAQLKRAGLVDTLESGSYQTPVSVSAFAMHKLKELGGQTLVDAAMSLRSADILRKVELILRYAQQSLLGECWKDSDTHAALIESVSTQFSNPLSAGLIASEDTNLFTMPLDPLQAFFEDYVLTHHPYVQQWLDMLEAFSFTLMRSQLEEVFDWAVEKEDWPLVRRFANRVGVNSSWIINAALDGKVGSQNWAQLGFAFALLKNITAVDAELLSVSMKGSHIKSTSWSNCQFVGTEWRGAHVKSSTFSGVDMVGMILPAGVIAGCTFTDVDARYSDFRGTIFEQCAFNNVNLRAARLENAKFIDCYFCDVDFRLTVVEESFSKQRR